MKSLHVTFPSPLLSYPDPVLEPDPELGAEVAGLRAVGAGKNCMVGKGIIVGSRVLVGPTIAV